MATETTVTRRGFIGGAALGIASMGLGFTSVLGAEVPFPITLSALQEFAVLANALPLPSYRQGKRTQRLQDAKKSRIKTPGAFESWR